MPLLIKTREISGYLQMVETRMPFRYGSANLTRCPHLYLVATIEDAQGRTARGIASDNLPPLWFDKNPAKSFPQQLDDMLQVVEWSRQAALSESLATPFALWYAVYRATVQQSVGLPSLLAGFGPSLIERAINDAVGNLLQRPFHALLINNDLGIDFGILEPSLRDYTARQLLPAQPVASIWARHAIGLSDPIRTADIAEQERLHDGLPQSLEEVIDFYGVRYFKIKVQNKLETDIERLCAIADVLERMLPDGDYRCTLDGNEQYETVEQLRPLLEALQTRPELRNLAASIVFIEQPLARAVALEHERCAGIEAIARHYPVIIDESDGALESYALALELGYSGTSHKNCKNTFKSLLNLARSRRYEAATGRPSILSAEDLTNIGPVALQEDLTALTSLGITHAERNGHHYFRGLSHLSETDQERILTAHPDLYCRDANGVRVNIADGRMHCASLHATSGLGVGAWPRVEEFMPRAEFDSSVVE
jgi:hypothetical protein